MGRFPGYTGRIQSRAGFLDIQGEYRVEQVSWIYRENKEQSRFPRYTGKIQSRAGVLDIQGEYRIQQVSWIYRENIEQSRFPGYTGRIQNKTGFLDIQGGYRIKQVSRIYKDISDCIKCKCVPAEGKIPLILRKSPSFLIFSSICRLQYSIHQACQIKNLNSLMMRIRKVERRRTRNTLTDITSNVQLIYMYYVSMYTLFVC